MLSCACQYPVHANSGMVWSDASGLRRCHVQVAVSPCAGKTPTRKGRHGDDDDDHSGRKGL